MYCASIWSGTAEVQLQFDGSSRTETSQIFVVNTSKFNTGKSVCSETEARNIRVPNPSFSLKSQDISEGYCESMRADSPGWWKRSKQCIEEEVRKKEEEEERRKQEAAAEVKRKEGEVKAMTKQAEEEARKKKEEQEKAIRKKERDRERQEAERKTQNIVNMAVFCLIFSVSGCLVWRFRLDNLKKPNHISTCQVKQAKYEEAASKNQRENQTFFEYQDTRERNECCIDPLAGAISSLLDSAKPRSGPRSVLATNSQKERLAFLPSYVHSSLQTAGYDAESEAAGVCSPSSSAEEKLHGTDEVDVFPPEQTGFEIIPRASLPSGIDAGAYRDNAGRAQPHKKRNESDTTVLDPARKKKQKTD